MVMDGDQTYSCSHVVVHTDVEPQCCLLTTYVIKNIYNLFLETKMETYSSILAWEIPWTEESLGLQESDTTE